MTSPIAAWPNRERFARELHRLRGYRFKRLLIIGTREDIAAGRYHSKIAPKAVLATLGAFEIRFDLPVVYAETPETAASLIERIRLTNCTLKLPKDTRVPIVDSASVVTSFVTGHELG